MPTTPATRVFPRQLAHRGVLPDAAGLWFDAGLYEEADLRRRILALWRDGDRVLAAKAGYLLIFGAPRRMDCRVAEGAPVVVRAGVFLALPLSPGEWGQLRPPTGSLVLARGGIAEPVTELNPFDVALWLDGTGWKHLTVEPLGSAPVVPLAQMPLFDLRSELKVQAGPELQAFFAAFGVEGDIRSRTSSSQWGRVWASWVESWLEPLRSTLRNALRGRAQRVEGPRSRSKSVISGWFLSPVGRNLLLAWLVGCLLFGIWSGLRDVHFSVVPLHYAVLLVGLLAAAVTLLRWLGVLFSLAGAGRPKTGAPAISARPSGLQIRPGAKPKRTRLFRTLTTLVACALLVNFGGALTFAAMMALLSSAFIFGTVADVVVGQKLAAATRQSTAGQSAPPPPEYPRQQSRAMLDRLRDAWRLMLWNSYLRRIFGQRQAAYMLNSLRLFERGDLEAALRHAVPLEDLERLAGRSRAPVLGVPRPRTRLELTDGGFGGGGIALPESFKEQLLRQYRLAYEKLAAQGRIHEATFVLAELLNQPAEAVAFLESQGEFRLAAEMASLRRLDPAIEVRLWWLAGDTARAVLVARQRRAFAGAVERLEAAGPEHSDSAMRLRLLWADSLARAGDFAGAVQVAWQLPQARGLLGSWMETGYAAGGTVAATMLAHQGLMMAELDAEARARWTQRVEKLLADADSEVRDLLAGQTRLAFATALKVETPQPLVAAAMRRTVRALLRDSALYPPLSAACSDALRSLAKTAGDGPLRHDVARTPVPAAAEILAKRSLASPLTYQSNEAERGGLAVTDAALLADGTTVVALGEMGVRLLGRDGRTLAHLDQPCHQLVLAANGDRAIGVAHRTGARERLLQRTQAPGGSLHLSRLDFVHRTASYWGLLSDVRAFAASYDGSLWMAATSERLLALDASAEHPAALWNTPGVGWVHHVVWSPQSLATLSSYAEPSEHNEVWRFDWPSITLRERNLSGSDAEFVTAQGQLLRGSGGVTILPVAKDAQPTPEMTAERTLLQGDGGASNRVVLQALGLEDWGLAFVAVDRPGSESTVTLRAGTLDGEVFNARLVVVLQGAASAHARLHAGILTLCDDCGRVLAIDLLSGQLLRNLKLF